MHNFSIIRNNFHVSLVFRLCSLLLNFCKVYKSLSRFLTLYDQLPTIFRRIFSLIFIIIIRCCRTINIFEELVVYFWTLLFFRFFLFFVPQHFIICQVAFVPVGCIIFASLTIVIDWDLVLGIWWKYCIDFDLFDVFRLSQSFIKVYWLWRSLTLVRFGLIKVLSDLWLIGQSIYRLIEVVSEVIFTILCWIGQCLFFQFFIAFSFALLSFLSWIFDFVRTRVIRMVFFF